MHHGEEKVVVLDLLNFRDWFHVTKSRRFWRFVDDFGGWCCCRLMLR